MAAGGIDPDEELRNNMVKLPSLLSKKAVSEAAQKIIDYEASLTNEIDEDKRLTTRFALMIEHIRVELSEAAENKKKELKGQIYTETSLLRIIVAMD